MDITPLLEPDKLLQLLNVDGPIARFLPKFETRQEQLSMMRDIIAAFNHRKIALIEAGTGTGKSMAYLIPAIVAAVTLKEKVVISTNTISLQEQLLYKDIPLILSALQLSLKVVLVKGMNNYLCLRKIEELNVEKFFLPKEEQAEIEQIEQSLLLNTEGCRSKLPFVPSQKVWEQVSAEQISCLNLECPNYQECFFFKARKSAAEASLLIVNHHLLFADLAMRAETDNWKNTAVLPYFDRLILDEAHHIEDIATEYFASKLSQVELLKLLGRLSSEKSHRGKSFGKLPLLKEKIASYAVKDPSKEIIALLNKLNIDLPARRRDLMRSAAQTFFIYYQFLSQHLDQNNLLEGKLRILKAHLSTPKWQEEVAFKTKELSEQIQSYTQDLNSIENELKELNCEKILEQTKGIRFEIKNLSKCLEEREKMLREFIDENFLPNEVRWIESESYRGISNHRIIKANLDISELLVKFLFDKLSTVILCSATLSCDKKFDYLRYRLGLKLDDPRVLESSYKSPFDFNNQASLLIPQDLPSPNQDLFPVKASEVIFKAIEASRGNAFVLFTSHALLKTCAELLATKLKKERYPLFQQGTESRKKLLENFRKTERAILFGTNSFWEGIDVVGEALRCVIITKLPFKVPNDPLSEAKAEFLSARGKNPFLEYFLPGAVVKFKQGFGRLIRTKEDRGCIICLDHRIVSKGYGRVFMDSLPNCQKIIGPTDFLQKYMIDFYKRRN